MEDELASPSVNEDLEQTVNDASLLPEHAPEASLGGVGANECDTAALVNEASSVTTGPNRAPAKPGYRIKKKAASCMSSADDGSQPTLSHNSETNTHTSCGKTLTASGDEDSIVESADRPDRADGENLNYGSAGVGSFDSTRGAKFARRARSKVPFGWLDSPKGGDAICGICPVKTPLSSNYELDPSARWTPADCIGACGGDQVRLMIDLTASERYYSSEELPSTVVYHKAAVSGHGIPTEQQVSAVLERIQKMRDEHGDKAIAVIHCTHGLNRTGVNALLVTHDRSGCASIHPSRRRLSCGACAHSIEFVHSYRRSRSVCQAETSRLVVEDSLFRTARRVIH